MISFELGHVYARAGVRVMILEALPRLLPAMDADAVARLQTESERIGIGFKTTVVVKRIERVDGRLRVIFTHDGDEHAAEADRVVNGAGRIANVDELDLASGRVEHDHGRVAVDDYLRLVSNLRVYVCGDALATSPQLSPLANYEGDIVGRNIVDSAKHRPDYEGMATAVYTVPALAAVGLRKPRPGRRDLPSAFMSTTCLEGSQPRPTPKPSRGPRSSLTARPTASSASILSATTDRN